MEQTTARVTAKRRQQYHGRVGTITKRDEREGRSYLGLVFEGVSHVVWFFESELELHA
jgi:hypothetical protein